MWTGYSVLFMCGVFKFIQCDWESDWMSPVQERLHTDSGKGPVIDEDDVKLLSPLSMDSKEWNLPLKSEPLTNKQSPPISLSQLKTSLKNALDAATIFQENVKEKITATESRERMFKEVIANGRLGVTSAVIKTVSGSSKSYIIKNGVWSLCDGTIQAVAGGATDGRLTPTCLGEEVPSSKDMCVFNSIIKYDVVPEHRGQEYDEEQFLCLKNNFNNTFEQYWSVPKRVVAETCKKGQVRSMLDNMSSCGTRIMSEYTFYPYKSSESLLPLEYCTEKDGTCRMVVAWSLTNKSIENYELLKSDVNFQKHFIDLSRTSTDYRI